MFEALSGIHRIHSSSSRGSGDGDIFIGRLLKLIPGEALVVYPIGKAATPHELAPYWPPIVLILIVFLRILTTREKHRNAQAMAVVISCITFVIWVLANGDPIGPFEPNFKYADIFLVWAGLIWLVVASAFYKGSGSSQDG